MHSVTLKIPRMAGRRLIYEWNTDSPFSGKTYWVEYPGLEPFSVPTGRALESLLPLCIAFSAIPDMEIRLPYRLPDAAFSVWQEIIEKIASRCFRYGLKSRLVNGISEPAYPKVQSGRPALFFGGGTESLLTLSRLLEHGERPLLVSLGGPRWSGSDPEKNPVKFQKDEDIARDLDLEVFQVRTNFREITNAEAWKPYMNGVSLVNAATLLPFFISFVLPAAERMQIGRLINGNEKMNFPHEYFCFSPDITSLLRHAAQGIRYESHLSDIRKEEVCRELYRFYPHIASYQYSCWRNEGSRWCYQCESCLEYYALLIANRRHPSLVGMEEDKIRQARNRLVGAVARSAEGRPGEIWMRLVRYPVLRSDPWLRGVLDEIAWKAPVFHRINGLYGSLPEPLKNYYRQLKNRKREKEYVPDLALTEAFAK